MPFPLVPVVICGAAGFAAYRVHQRKQGMTPEREEVFAKAMKSKDPAAMREVAASFRKCGCKEQAKLIEKRAKLRELPPAQQEARTQAFRQMMTSQNPDAVEEVAKAFYSEGCFDAHNAGMLYARGLRATSPDEIRNIATQVGELSKKNGPSVDILKQRADDAETKEKPQEG